MILRELKRLKYNLRLCNNQQYKHLLATNDTVDVGVKTLSKFYFKDFNWDFDVSNCIFLYAAKITTSDHFVKICSFDCCKNKLIFMHRPKKSIRDNGLCSDDEFEKLYDYFLK